MQGLRWAAYGRISDDSREGAGLGVKRQRKDVHTMILGIDPEATITDYTDNDLSAYTGKPRKEYERMLADIREGRIGAVCAWHTDRLHRSVIELEEYINICQPRDVATYTVKAGHIDLTTASGRMTARILGAVARGESEHKAERITSKHRQLAEDGVATGGGFRPYGYERIYDRPDRPHKLVREVIIPEEAEIIRECARRVLSGEGLYTVAVDLRARNVLTSAGKEWSTSSLARVLASARIAGMREHRPRVRGETKRIRIGEITAREAAWPPIISASQSAALRDLLSDSERRTSPGPTGRHLCAGGVLICGGCGKRMTGRSRGAEGKTIYHCDGAPGRPGCGHMNIDGTGTDFVVTGWVAARLADPAYKEWLERKEDKPDESLLRDDIAGARQRQKELARDWADGKISSEERYAARDALEARITRAQSQLARSSATIVLDGLPPDPGDLQAWLLDGEVPVARRRAVILAVLEKVDVASAVKGRGRFDAGRLSPVWKA
jgi:site-specific DNA recombinase